MAGPSDERKRSALWLPGEKEEALASGGGSRGGKTAVVGEPSAPPLGTAPKRRGRPPGSGRGQKGAGGGNAGRGAGDGEEEDYALAPARVIPSTPGRAKEPSEPDLEFAVLLDADQSRVKLPLGFAAAIAEHRPPTFWVREDSPRQDLWDCDVKLDGAGNMYLTRGWGSFAHSYGFQEGYLLAFRHRLGSPRLYVKVFNETRCRRRYVPAYGGGGQLWRAWD